MNKNVLVVKLLKSKFGRAKVERNYLTMKRKNRKKKKKNSKKQRGPKLESKYVKRKRYMEKFSTDYT